MGKLREASWTCRLQNPNPKPAVEKTPTRTVTVLHTYHVQVGLAGYYSILE
jgi:hypothetical protein